ncbi:MAG: hypothetical protein ACJ8DJ_09755, partial [Gemmatimonadales bacterium]
SYYNTMWGGWGYGWSTYYDPGYVQENQYVVFNTNVYQVDQEKLLWSSREFGQNRASKPRVGPLR